jgi:hypothetical protein
VSVLSLAAGGCLAHGRVSGGAEVSSDLILVELRPGVWVIEDYREPVFYADGYFWLYRDDGWYRSSDYSGGWVRFRSAPQVIVSIERPRQYIGYRAAPGHRIRRGPNGPISVRDRRDATPDVRDSGSDWQDKRAEKREEQQEKREEQQAAREEKREEKAEEKAEKAEEKAEKREEKAEEKAEKLEEKREEKAEKREEKADHKAGHKPGKGGHKK